MPRRTHRIPLLAAALAVGVLLALGVAACGGGSQSAETLDTPPLTVGTGATLPSTTASTTTTTTTTTTTDSSSAGTGGAAATGGTGGAANPGGGTTGGGTGGTTGGTGGGTTPATGGGGTTTPTQPANPGGASPNYQSFCRENPGAC